MKAARAHLAAAVLFAGIATLTLWPLPRLIEHAVADPSVLQNVVALHRYLLPLGIPPLLLHNILLLLGYAFTGYAGFVLARLVTGSWWAGLAGGIVLGLVPWRFAHVADTKQAWAGGLALVLAAAIAFIRVRSWQRALLFLLTAAVTAPFLIPFAYIERPAFPGFGPIVLALIGLIGPLGRDRRERGLLLATAVLLIAAGAFTAPVVAYTGLALLAGIGTMKIVRRWPLLGIVIAMALIAELRPEPLLRWRLIDTDEPPVYRYLAQSSDRCAILELPIRDDDSRYEYLFRTTIHRRPLAFNEELVRAFAQRPIDQGILERLKKECVTTIVVHGDTLGDETAAVRFFLLRAFDTGKLRFVGRFDRGVEGDYVFTHGAGDLKPYFGPQPLTRPIGWLDEPVADSEVRGPVRVMGWALAPAPIRRVRVHVDNRARTFEAQLFPRPDVAAIYPWHDASRSGFTIDIPRFREGRTDVEVEITDARGATIRLPQRWFVWSR